ncbi:hypothetical protein QQF64_021968 [Cirrhinus molitorella]|uniref:Protein POLR1D n=1 Tax=Cirrhinus molitorella TaxID=172907 RepID=A0ABR3L8A8_9TELE
MDESELERKAVEELLKEASRGKVRAETMGATGWMKCPLGSTNKRFLLNTLRSSALTRQPTNQRASERERDEHSHSASRSHSPHLSRKSERTRSRSPVRDSSPDVKKSTDRGGK